MSGGELAALIAAIAFVVLVIFVVRLLMQVSKTMTKVDKKKQTQPSVSLPKTLIFFQKRLKVFW